VRLRCYCCVMIHNFTETRNPHHPQKKGTKFRLNIFRFGAQSEGQVVKFLCLVLFVLQVL